MTALTPRERRLVAVALLLALIVAIVFGIIGPVAGGFSDRAEARAALLETYARDERAVVQVASARRAAEAQRRDAVRFRLEGETATLAADRLKERLAGAVGGAGGELRNVEDVAAAAGTIRVRAEARLGAGQLAALLETLQRGPALLVVDTLAVAADQSFQSGRAGPMDVRLEISGPYPAAAPR